MTFYQTTVSCWYEQVESESSTDCKLIRCTCSRGHAMFFQCWTIRYHQQDYNYNSWSIVTFWKQYFEFDINHNRQMGDNLRLLLLKILHLSLCRTYQSQQLCWYIGEMTFQALITVVDLLWGGWWKRVIQKWRNLYSCKKTCILRYGDIICILLKGKLQMDDASAEMAIQQAGAMHPPTWSNAFIEIIATWRHVKARERVCTSNDISFQPTGLIEVKVEDSGSCQSSSMHTLDSTARTGFLFRVEVAKQTSNSPTS